MQPGTVLKVANTELTKFLLQAELLAIKNGLKFDERDYMRKNKFRYTGYFNSNDNFEGVGVVLSDFGE